MDSDTEVMVAPVLPPGDLNQDRVLEEPSQGEPVAETKKRKVFPFHITSELRNLYRSGMVGVGVQYSSLIDAACQRTGLSKAQVKVSKKTLRVLTLKSVYLRQFVVCAKIV